MTALIIIETDRAVRSNVPLTGSDAAIARAAADLGARFIDGYGSNVADAAADGIDPTDADPTGPAGAYEPLDASLHDRFANLTANGYGIGFFTVVRRGNPAAYVAGYFAVTPDRTGRTIGIVRDTTGDTVHAITAAIDAADVLTDVANGAGLGIYTAPGYTGGGTFITDIG